MEKRGSPKREAKIETVTITQEDSVDHLEELEGRRRFRNLDRISKIFCKKIFNSLLKIKKESAPRIIDLALDTIQHYLDKYQNIS